MSYPIPNRVPLPVRRPDPQVMMAQGQPMAQPGGAFPQAPAQPPQQRRGLMDMASQNPEFFLSLGAGLLGGRTGREQWSGGLSGAAQALGTAKEKKEAKAKENATLKWLQSNAPEYADAVAQGVLSAGDAYKMHAEAKKPLKPDFMSAGDGRIFNKNTGEFITAPGAENGGMPKKALTTVLMRDPQGKITVGQVDSAGNLEPSKLNEGYTVVGPGDKAFDTKFGAESGKYAAENRNALPVKSAAAQNAVRLVDAILEHPSLSSAVGPIDGRLPSFSAGARDFDERVDQLRGQAFLQARQELKGGGQITDYEGQRAEAALVRASQAKGEDEFKAAMLEFKDAILRGYQILEQQAGASGISGQTPAGQGRTQSGITFTVEPD